MQNRLRKVVSEYNESFRTPLHDLSSKATNAETDLSLLGDCLIRLKAYAGYRFAAAILESENINATDMNHEFSAVREQILNVPLAYANQKFKSIEKQIDKIPKKKSSSSDSSPMLHEFGGALAEIEHIHTESTKRTSAPDYEYELGDAEPRVIGAINREYDRVIDVLLAHIKGGFDKSRDAAEKQMADLTEKWKKRLKNTHMANLGRYYCDSLMKSLNGVYWHAIDLTELNFPTNEKVREFDSACGSLKGSVLGFYITNLDFALSEVSILIGQERDHVTSEYHSLMRISSIDRTKSFKRLLDRTVACINSGKIIISGLDKLRTDSITLRGLSDFENMMYQFEEIVLKRWVGPQADAANYPRINDSEFR